MSNISELKDFIVKNNIHIPEECWRHFMNFLGSQLVAISTTCIDVNLIDVESSNKAIKCMKTNIPQYDELLKRIDKLNAYKHGFFERDLVNFYLALAYIAWTYDLKEKLNAVMLSYACFVLVSTFKKYFSKGCKDEYMQNALSLLQGKSMYKKFNLNHVEVVKYIVASATKLHTDKDDFVFRWMRNIKAHINQLMKTLASAYYRAVQQHKDTYSSASHQIDSNMLTMLLKQNLGEALQIIQVSKEKFRINLDDEILECIINHIDVDEVIRLLFIMMKDDENLRKFLFSSKTCNQLKTLYNKIYYLLLRQRDGMNYISKLAKECNTNQTYSIRKVLAYAIVISWKISVCN